MPRVIQCQYQLRIKPIYRLQSVVCFLQTVDCLQCVDRSYSVPCQSRSKSPKFLWPVVGSQETLEVLKFFTTRLLPQCKAITGQPIKKIIYFLFRRDSPDDQLLAKEPKVSGSRLTPADYV